MRIRAKKRLGFPVRITAEQNCESTHALQGGFMLELTTNLGAVSRLKTHLALEGRGLAPQKVLV